MIKSIEPNRKKDVMPASEICQINGGIMVKCTLQEKILPQDLQNIEPVNKYSNKEAIFEVNEFSPEGGKQPAPSAPAITKMCTIIWIREGSGNLSVDLQSFPFHDNTIFYIEPGQFYRFDPQTKILGLCISFSEAFMNMSEIFVGLSDSQSGNHQRFFKSAVNGGTLVNYLQELVREMINESANSFLLRIEVLRGLLGIFFVHLARNRCATISYKGTNHDVQLANKFMHLLNEGVCARKMVSDYAQQLGISPNHLNQTLKKHTGMTASRYIQEYTILEAKRRVLYFGTTMKEIAYHLGFEDLAHFSRFFKKNAGESFREFKNQTEFDLPPVKPIHVH